MNYERYKYEKYIGGQKNSRWATVEEIQKASTFVDLKVPGKSECGGIPLLSDGRKVYVDGKDTHTLIFGATGSKKTRLFCMPAINLFIKAGESFVATDPKGELYAKTAGYAEAEGYNIVVLNFRDLGYGDMWNPISIPYKFYNSGEKELAVSMINDFISAISGQVKKEDDPYWASMAGALLLANALILLECGKEEEANIGSLAYMCNVKVDPKLQEIAKRLPDTSISAMNYANVLPTPEKTKNCIYSTLYGMLKIFNTQKGLTRMLSGNTMDISKFGKEKTAVYIIVPDEKTTYHFLVTTFIKQVYEILVAEAQKQEALKLPVRVNFVLDEFCNIPKVPDMPSMISAARSRNMRYFLVAQSLHQLKGKYGEDADTIKGNCDNWVFLTSKELDLLQEVSSLCGTISGGEESRPLISVSQLQRLDKEKGEALIMHARQYPMITEIADIDMYEAFKGYTKPPLKPFDLPELRFFSVDNLAVEIKYGKRPVPFTEESDRSVSADDIPDEEKPLTEAQVKEILDRTRRWIPKSDSEGTTE